MSLLKLRHIFRSLDFSEFFTSVKSCFENTIENSFETFYNIEIWTFLFQI